MILTTKTRDFSAELAATRGCVETQDNLPVSGMVNLKAKGKDLIITATNLDFGIRSKVSADVKAEGSFLVDVKRLSDWTSRLAVLDEDLSIKLNMARISFKAGKSNCSIAQSDPANFPPFPIPTGPVCKISSEELAKLLSGILPVIGDFEDQRFNYAGAQLIVESGKAIIAATNGNRLACSEIDIATEVTGLKSVITRKAIVELIRAAGKAKGEVAIAQSENNLFFNFGNRLMYCRRLRDAFPRWQGALPDPTGQTVAKVESVAAISALSRVMALLGASKMILVDLAEGSLSFSSASDLGESADQIAAEYTGEAYQFGINSSWLMDALKNVGPKADIGFTDNPSHPIEVRPEGSIRFRNIMGRMGK